MNEAVFYLFHSLAGRFQLFDLAIVFFADTFPWLLVAGLVVFLLRERLVGLDKIATWPSEKHAKEITVIVFTAITAWFVAFVLKFLAYSPRPFVALPDVSPLFMHGEGTDSFPSGHATFFFAIATGLHFYHRKLAWWYFAGALAIGASRVIAGIHWPLDILAGYLLGGAIAYAIFYLYRRME